MFRAFLTLLLALCFLPNAMTARRDDRVRIEFVTTAGTFTVALFKETPVHAANFEKLVREGFYTDILFHRVIRNFMIQAGDPASKTATAEQVLGEGELPYTLPLELALPYIYHYRGALAAAREPDDVNPERRSSSTQFYIVWGKTYTPQQLAGIMPRVDAATGMEGTITPDMAPDYMHRGGTPHLDGQYTVFGEIVSGLKVIGKIQKAETDDNDRPLQDIRILSAKVLE
ncbi:peptidylprolyl isomerase [Alloprevotella sp. OH1205_COT-284]|uniref:peptidylprolyl isomerase n=1 Tax=Alloprevotella sp. OH1205_COT-284 TaxID=2491043 RepID=UPI000F601400|nr:peptidylprolyl isomerase [Alloprevotella sp. OH1205_COT-284]RRD77743.1 peptidylprolyl isomerase [Alloprevotella sp. OH1205_COT-284]